ncbi:hypothetical protein FPHOBKDP_00162 [Listeria phage LPJP1]|nr:hypothetical protein FPHOBKDP_00162 [Listeria phage LPJP1]
MKKLTIEIDPSNGNLGDKLLRFTDNYISIPNEELDKYMYEYSEEFIKDLVSFYGHRISDKMIDFIIKNFDNIDYYEMKIPNHIFIKNIDKIVNSKNSYLSVRSVMEFNSSIIRILFRDYMEYSYDNINFILSNSNIDEEFLCDYIIPQIFEYYKSYKSEDVEPIIHLNLMIKSSHMKNNMNINKVLCSFIDTLMLNIDYLSIGYISYVFKYMFRIAEYDTLNSIKSIKYLINTICKYNSSSDTSNKEKIYVFNDTVNFITNASVFMDDEYIDLISKNSKLLAYNKDKLDFKNVPLDKKEVMAENNNISEEKLLSIINGRKSNNFNLNMFKRKKIIH